jgi:hypothetical protein
MTEQEHVAATDLAKLRIVLNILRDCACIEDPLVRTAYSGLAKRIEALQATVATRKPRKARSAA